MKQIFITLFLLAGFGSALEARTLVAAVDGDWAVASTWNPAFVPTHLDMVIIPGDRTVTINSNLNQTTTVLDIRVAGRLNFIGGGAKLRIAGGSIVYVYPAGEIYANQNSQVIIIGGTTVLNASNSGTLVTGPSAATAGSTTNNLSSSSTPTGFMGYSPSALPVEFIAFTATRQGSDVLVQWSTAGEVNADRFEVEVSRDGRSWETVGTLAAAGNSNTLKQYSYTARGLAGSVQVRVKQLDFGGRFMYTSVRSLRATSDASIKMTVASGRLVLNFTNEVKGATVRILNLAGQVLQEQKMTSAIGQVLVPTTQKGLCIVAVLTDSEIAATQKVIL
ncbi:MAG: hypothetical protein EOO15_02470 [Chitinophagaceae bacterium]|nr:MAG: hypothetical protein EOO15_02470 [Chitinophagaceae bacterium]